MKRRELKVAGHPQRLFVDSLSSRCGGIVDGVSFEFNNDGSWVISLQELKQLVADAEKFQNEHRNDRCAVCGWFLGATIQDGCVRGNCSMRPRPARLFDAERAALEAKP